MSVADACSTNHDAAGVTSDNQSIGDSLIGIDAKEIEDMRLTCSDILDLLSVDPNQGAFG